MLEVRYKRFFATHRIYDYIHWWIFLIFTIIFFVCGIYAKPNPTGPSSVCPETTSRPIRPLKSSPTSDSILACSLACSIHAVQTGPSRSVLLSWRARMVLKASTCSLAHFTHALMRRGGKQAWKVETVFRIIVKYTKDTAQIY